MRYRTMGDHFPDEDAAVWLREGPVRLAQIGVVVEAEPIREAATTIEEKAQPFAPEI
jgi:hypothetical protein